MTKPPTTYDQGLSDYNTSWATLNHCLTDNDH